MQPLNTASKQNGVVLLAQHVVGCTESHFSSHHRQMAAASFFLELQSSTCELHFCRSLCPAPKPICRRRSQTPRLLCSACSLRFVTPWATLDSVRSIHTTCRVPHKASNAQWNVHSSQASEDARSQCTSKHTNAANQQVPKRRVFTTNKAKWYNNQIPITATHQSTPLHCNWR